MEVFEQVGLEPKVLKVDGVGVVELTSTILGRDRANHVNGLVLYGLGIVDVDHLSAIVRGGGVLHEFEESVGFGAAEYAAREEHRKGITRFTTQFLSQLAKSLRLLRGHARLGRRGLLESARLKEHRVGLAKGAHSGGVALCCGDVDASSLGNLLIAREALFALDGHPVRNDVIFHYAKAARKGHADCRRLAVELYAYGLVGVRHPHHKALAIVAVMAPELCNKVANRVAAALECGASSGGDGAYALGLELDVAVQRVELFGCQQVLTEKPRDKRAGFYVGSKGGVDNFAVRLVACISRHRFAACGKSKWVADLVAAAIERLQKNMFMSFCLPCF